MSAIARKTPLILIALGAGLLFASLRFTVGGTRASAAPKAEVVAPVPAAPQGEPASNEISDFQQLD